tara:strand:- start:62 stop:769 length:708 start_codon:yes stop_codon:yes gene_type:complete
MKPFFEPGFLQAVGTVFSDIQKELKKYMNFDSEDSRFLSRSLLIKDLKALNDFMGGILQRFNGIDDPAVQQFVMVAQQLKKQLTSVLDQLASQMVLSKDNDYSTAISDRFHYWQIPNPFVQNPSPLDILIQKEGGKNVPIDPDKTNLKLKFHTESLGEIMVDLRVEDRQVWSSFKTERLETKSLVSENMIDLNSRFAALNYQLRALQSVQKKVDIKQFIIPKAKLTDISRVSSEV